MALVAGPRLQDWGSVRPILPLRTRARMGDLWSRQGRAAVLAADADHPRQRESFAARLGLSHEAARGARFVGGRARLRPVGSHTLDRRWDDVRRHAVRPGGGARADRWVSDLDLQVTGRAPAIDARRRVFSRRRANAAAGRVRHRWWRHRWERTDHRPACSRVDAKTGKPNASFGVDGMVDLSTPEFSNGISSPPIVYKNLIITGSHTAALVRAWDVHTGKLVWTFSAVPRPARSTTTPGVATAGRASRVSIPGA